MSVQYSFTITYSNNHVGRKSNPTVKEIFRRYVDNGKILGISEDSSGPNQLLCTMNFLDSAAYTEWYNEIDSVDTTPPSTITYGAPTEPF